MWNFRQTESAFWTYYIPRVVGHIVPTYPPTTEFWWEPRTPLQIAFWSISGFCLLLIVLLVVCCMLWRNAKRSSDRYYNPYLYPPDAETDNEGIENNEYAEKYPTPRVAPARTNSASSFQSVSLKEMQGFISSTPNGDTPRKGTPILPSKHKSKSQTLPQGVPQTDV
ncbi:hypothetical protein NQ318_016056 [Aromia moschata]|uniref:Uncharacterized protein n=1 Tax=Aromia moschata TaxID=1265417 RepID=A0AAV8XU58_9CUCU|nr:hypothetical protein NQ318_016056 [Aromia moschata]